MKPDDTKLLVMWWNINRRLSEILKNISPISEQKPDVVFVSETSAGYDAIPNIQGYAKYADKDVRALNHGGIAFYVKNALVPHVFNVNFNTCYVSFRLNFMPSIVFIGCYIQPENSRYFEPNMFSELGSFLLSLREKKLIPFVGGDLNCRFGDLNLLQDDNGLLYDNNIDSITNKHGITYGKDICTVGDVFPVNHLIYRGKVFEGDFTYFKGGKKSQIDFVYSCKDGLKIIKNFTIQKDNWHLSDHRAISVELSAYRMVNSAFLLKRSKELNYEFQPNRSTIVRHLGTYDIDVFTNYLRENDSIIQNEVLGEISKSDIHNAIRKFDIHLHEAHRVAKKKKINADNNIPKSFMLKANSEFDNYRKTLNGQATDTPEEALRKYQEARSNVSNNMHGAENKRWKNLVESGDSKSLWESIDWKGNLSKSETVKPSNEKLALHFEKLYKCTDPEESAKIEELSTNTYNPALDDPISPKELDDALKEMKKGGYDYSLSILKILTQMMSPMLLLFFNIMFFIAYPVTLAKSLLSALPKKGNLSLPVNYRGIQMLAALSSLYDRIISIRLRSWCVGLVSYVQTAFQKGKSTVHQLFTIRLLVEIAKRTNTTIYIGFFDLEKAFDKVSRVLLLKKLIQLGIGNCMLQALKRIYLYTTCIIGNASDASDEFRTYSGIRQGAPSSVLLFILFMDELISFLQRHCVEEPILNTMHCMLHADDTVIISTDRKLFVDKCNRMLQYFDENNLSLNLSKSSYLIINGKEEDTKCDIQLNHGMLEYKARYVYLGAIITDMGCILSDIEQYIVGKRANVTIKYNNFLRKNFLAPLSIKLKVLDACVSSTLIYGCESWGTSSINSIEVAYRQGLKRALSIRESCNTEIVYAEAGRFPLSIRISKQQLKFWIDLQSYLTDNPEHPLASLINLGQELNLPYLRHYQKLEENFTTPHTCLSKLTQTFLDESSDKIRRKANGDDESRLGMYLQVNPNLVSPTYRPNTLEFERVMISRYRTGSHNLRIETGRLCNPTTPREERTCRCNTGIQSLAHCLFNCPLLHDLYEKYNFASVEEALNSPDIPKFLLEMEKTLQIQNIN